MDLYLIRHGYAEPYGHAGRKDEERALTPLGRDLVRRAATELKRRGVAPAIILSSPFRRAVETAELLNLGLSPSLGVHTVADLASGTNPDTLLAVAHAHQEAGPVLLVGHNPEIDGAVRWLAGRAGVSVGPMRPSTIAWFQGARFPDLSGIHLAGQWEVEDLADASEPGRRS